MKTCRQCHNSLPLTSFNGNRTRPDGLSLYCRDCAYKRQQDSRKRQRIARVLTACKGEIPGELLREAEELRIYQCAKCQRWLSYGHFYHIADLRANVCNRCCADTVPARKPRERGNKMPRSTRLTVESFMDQFRESCGGLLPEHCLPPVEEGAEGAEGAEP